MRCAARWSTERPAFIDDTNWHISLYPAIKRRLSDAHYNLYYNVSRHGLTFHLWGRNERNERTECRRFKVSFCVRIEICESENMRIYVYVPFDHSINPSDCRGRDLRYYRHNRRMGKHKGIIYVCVSFDLPWELMNSILIYFRSLVVVCLLLSLPFQNTMNVISSALRAQLVCITQLNRNCLAALSEWSL